MLGTHDTLNIMRMIGLIMWMGLTKNAIPLVDVITRPTMLGLPVIVSSECYAQLGAGRRTRKVP